MTFPYSLIVFFLLLPFPLDAHSAPYRYRLDIHRCSKPSDALMQSLDKGWLPWQHFVRICPVPGPSGKVRLSVLTIRLDLDAKARNRAVRDRNLPGPDIINAEGRTVGHLLSQFPVDPPDKMRITFADFRDDWPWKIELFEEWYRESLNITLGEVPPMIWREETHDYCWNVTYATKGAGPSCGDE